tara:strand:+ start:81 stop:854 length:774 start_codon:yes stop_codon:yes gene_type:complete
MKTISLQSNLFYFISKFEMEKTKLLTKYPNIGKCIDQTSNMVELLRQNPDCELEARFGNICQDRFHPGVNRVFMDSIIENMQKSAFVKGDDEWKEETDIYFEHDGRQLRTRVKYDSNTMNVISETTEKKMLTRSLDFVHKLDEYNGGIDVRISLKTEKEVTNPPLSVNPYLVRIKQRRRFVTENDTWAFDFSMTWSGISKSAAEYSQMNNDAMLEIECELLDTDKYVKQKSNEYISASLLLKMLDFLPASSNLEPKN